MKKIYLLVILILLFNHERIFSQGLDPSITCGPDEQITACGDSGAIVNYLPPTTSDGSSGIYILVSLKRISGQASGSLFPIGDTIIVWEADWQATNPIFGGFTATCSTKVTVLPPHTYYLDNDGDGHGDSTKPHETCDPVAIPPYVNNNTDCDDTDPSVWQSLTVYKDADGDGYGPVLKLCYGNQLPAIPAGYSSTTPPTLGPDCNDNDPTVWQSTILYIDNDGDGYDNGNTSVCWGDTWPYGETIIGSNIFLKTPPGTSLTTKGPDCNDNNAAVHASFSFYADNDQDGYGAGPLISGICSFDANTPPAGYSINNTDCNDNDPNVHSPITYYQDADRDGFGNPLVSTTVCSLTPPDGYVTNSSDCDDTKPDINPNTQWVLDADNDGYYTGNIITQCTSPGNGYVQYFELFETGCLCAVPNKLPGDCDDNNAAVHATFSFYADNDHDGFGAGPLIAGVCAVDANTPPPGYSTNNTDCDDNGNAVWQTVTEYIDKDHDGYDAGSRVVCAGLIDPFQLQIAGFSLSTNGPDCDDNNAAVHSTFSFYADNDHDGFGAGPLIVGVCAADANTPPPGYSINNTDCDDNNSAVWRQVIEFTDKDHDGYSVGAGVFTCVGVIDPSALYAAGLSLTSNGSDCNDNDPAVHATFSFYADNDHDGFGAGPLISGVCAVDANTPPPGYSTNSTDCNDNNAVLNPATVWYKDADNDGYSSGATLTQCLRPTGYKLASELIAKSGDCNDNDPGINAGAVEVCNNKVDDNCNGVVDEKSACFPCQNGTNLTTTNITSTSATFNWSATANPQQWHVQYKPVAPGGQWVDVPLLFGNIRAVTVISPPLLANQTYHWQISAKCNGAWTSYSDAGTFKTAKSGGAISSITATTLNNSTLKLYPNPNKGNFLIELNVLDKINANATIQLIDMTGKTVQMDIARINNGALQKTIHVSPALAEGLYMVRILVNDTVYKTQMIYAK